MIGRVVDNAVIALDSWRELATPEPAELDAVRDATPARRAEFATTRSLAHTALAQLGLDAGPLLAGADRAPKWPPGAVGSLTHCAGYRAAAVARRREIAGIGIDAEPDAPLPEEIHDMIATAGEFASWRAATGLHADAGRLVFSAKESLFKAWYPYLGVWIDFGDAEVFGRSDGTFEATIAPAGIAARHCSGRWAAGSGLVVTAVVLRP